MGSDSSGSRNLTDPRARAHAYSDAKRHIRKTILNMISCMDLNEIVLNKYV